MGDWKKVNATNIVQHKPSGTYYLRAKVRGKVIRRSLGVKSLRVAKIKRDELLLALRSAAVASPGAVGTVADALALAVERHAGRAGIKPKTVKYWRDLGAYLERSLPLAVPAKQLTTDELRRWWSMTCSDVAPQTANNCLGLLRTVCAVLVEAGLKLEDISAPLKRVAIPRKEVTALSREQLEGICASIRSQGLRASEEAANMVEFLAFSGCRISEARAACWEDVSEEWLSVKGAKSRARGFKLRRVPISDPLRGVLERMRYEGAAGPVFSLYSPRYALSNACKRLGLPHQRVHDLRHFFATYCIERGVEIPTVAKWLGHEDGGVLAMRTYGHLRDQHSLEQAKKL